MSIKQLKQSREELLIEIENLKVRLAESEKTLMAIRSGEVDGVKHAIGVKKANYHLKDRKRDDEKNQKLIQSVLDNVNSGVALIDETGRFTVCNPMFLKLFGLSEGASIKNVNDQNWAEWKVFDEDSTLLDVDDHPVRKAAITGKGIEQQLVGVRLPAGSDIIWMLISAKPLYKDNGKIEKIICTYHDITERKKMEESLKISEERFRLALNNTPVSVAIQDSNLVYTWAFNQKTRSTAEIIGKTDADLFAPEDLEWINPLKATILKTGKEMNIEKWLTSNGKRLFLGIHYEPILDSSGKITGIGTATFDLTTRKLAEEILDFQSLLLSEVNDAVFSSDSNYTITYWNKAAEKLTGWTKEEALGKNSGELLKPKIDGSSRDRERSKLRNAGHWEGEVHYIRKDGTYFIAEVNSAVLKDSEGKDTGNVIVARDITEQKKAEQIREQLLHEIERQAAWLTASISSMATGIILYGMDGKATHMNETAKKLLPEELFFNYAIEERSRIINWEKEDGKPFPTEEIPVKRAFNGETTINMVLGTLIHDKKLWISTNAAPILSQDGKILGVVASFLDITENKNAEIALRLSEERLRVTLESIGDAVMTFDTLCRVVFLNPVATKLTGWNQEDAKGQPVEKIFRILNELTMAPAEDIVAKVLHEGKVVVLSNHTALISKNGIQIPIEDSAAPIKDVNGNITGVVLVFHDVTEKRFAQEALRKSEERFRNLVKYAPTAIYEIDFTSRKFISVNDSMCKLSGYSRAELMTLDALDLLDEESRKLFLLRISKSLKGEEPDENVEYKVRSKDGRIINAVLNMKFNFNEQGTPVGALVVGHDITELKRAAEELRKAGEALRENEGKLKELIATKDKFFNIVAHDLKNPFTSLIGSSELLYANINHLTPEQTRSLALLLNDSAKRGYSILLNLLDWSRSQTGLLKISTSEVNLTDLIADNISEQQLSARNKNISIINESKEDIYLITDGNILNTVLRNLLSNSIKFTPKFGKVVVAVTKESDNITILVKDNGIGISSDRIRKLFNIDSRNSTPGTENEQGTGLGLKLSKEFIEKLGGRISVESIIDIGSTFRIRFPLK